MGSEIRETPGVLSWDQGQYTLWDCCHGNREWRHYRCVVIGPGTIHITGLLSWDQGYNIPQACGHRIRDITYPRRVVMGSGTIHNDQG